MNNWQTDGIQGMRDATQSTIMAQNNVDVPLMEDL